LFGEGSEANPYFLSGKLWNRRHTIWRPAHVSLSPPLMMATVWQMFPFIDFIVYRTCTVHCFCLVGDGEEVLARPESLRSLVDILRSWKRDESEARAKKFLQTGANKLGLNFVILSQWNLFDLMESLKKINLQFVYMKKQLITFQYYNKVPSTT